MTQIIGPKDVAGKLTWTKVVDAIKHGHTLPKAQVGDTFLGADGNTLLSRAAWIEGLGLGVKSVSVFPKNAGGALPTIQGAMLVFEDREGVLKAIIDSALITNWKTVADSLLGAQKLARPNSQRLVIVGAGTVAENLVAAYSEMFPSITDIQIWNRTHARAQALATQMQADGYPCTAAENLTDACSTADIISCATMSRDPVLLGDMIPAGCHVDLIGAFKADMREVDDAAMTKARIFVDSYDTTLHHIGELMMPLANGAITEQDVLADHYELATGALGRTSDTDITLFKNGGGAHLDLMTADCILKAMAT